ncbi:YccF domain-containing protein [Caulobacter sp.]|uniref:YccF domain-containing protein n=1 Tax=Caulobacter sp. TaxID=78 RepID=UPI003BA98FB5
MIRLILNILWFILGGWISGLLWLLGGALLAITVVGLPYTGAAWRIAGFAFWPFGKEIVSREIVTGRGDLGTGPLGFLLNIIWFILGGWYIALSHLMIAFAEAITIIGIPFAIKDFQLAIIALAPIGREVVVVRR